ncbi:unnamed protein product [Cladocopium goreaui]|uniref:Uncharacterized protein n=1 Tax=Cladocopium goreaui TaxID=2562237 RepID=A0A9P1FK93_9DINO|nr:unnamed protein product [Cladocopium goreaui]
MMKNAYTPVVQRLLKLYRDPVPPVPHVPRSLLRFCSACAPLCESPRCEKMDLLHPSIDLTLEPKAPRSRELLEHRFTERELFKRILSSNAADAKAVWLSGWMTTGQLTRRDTLSKLVLYPNGRAIQISLPSTPKGPLGHVGHSKRDMTCASNLNLFDLVPSQIPHVIAKHNMRFSTKVQAVVGTSQKLPEAG